MTTPEPGTPSTTRASLGTPGVGAPTGAVPFEQARLGPLTLRNRIIKAATFEGVMPRGTITQDLIDFHARVARGGAALTTVAYCAVSADGRVHRNTLVMDGKQDAELRRLTDAVHAEGALVAAQLGHAGYVADQRSNRMPSMGPSTRLSAPGMGLVKAATPAQLERVLGDFRRAAQVAVDTGFDAIEIHLGHNYLLSSFLSPNLNRRKDHLGGSIENRSRFPREVVAAVREVVGSGVAVTAKLNMADGVPQGLWLEESLQFARLLQDDGHLDAMQLTGGSSLLNGMYFFRGEVPLRELAATQATVVGWGLRAFGKKMLFPEYPFEEAFFLPFARQFRAALDMPLILLGGINELDTIQLGLDEGFQFVAMARALLREPDLINQYQSKGRTTGLCVHCNKCMPTIYTGTRCVLADAPEPALH
ncbi:NADH:flavin oxidoreductase [Rhodococcus sp. X156]|uniref:NADH:flavin oxidoreductase n=1 Tax=Rhodococcus sp. X156 TaxID=2499145 RepID=UPI000FDB1516|nr:NADH:flavin oxidoreductase [Rhodococcus sp. X156]